MSGKGTTINGNFDYFVVETCTAHKLEVMVESISKDVTPFTFMGLVGVTNIKIGEKMTSKETILCLDHSNKEEFAKVVAYLKKHKLVDEIGFLVFKRLQLPPERSISTAPSPEYMKGAGQVLSILSSSRYSDNGAIKSANLKKIYHQPSPTLPRDDPDDIGLLIFSYDM